MLMELSRERKNEIWGIIIIAFAVLLGISLFFSSAGIVGEILKAFFMVLSGKGAYVFPFLCFVWGIGVIRSRSVKASGRFVGLMIVLCTALTFLHVVYVPHGSEFPAALEQQGGGFIGCIFSYFLRNFLGETGTYVVLGAVTLIGLLLLFDILLIALFSTIKTRWQSFWNKVASLVKKTQEKIANFFSKFRRNQPKPDDLGFGDQGDDQDDQFLNELALLEEAQIVPEIAVAKEPELVVDVKTTVVEQKASPIVLQKKEYQLPPVKLLRNPPQSKNKTEVVDQSQLLEDTLKSFGVQASIVSVSHGPTITRYELQPAPGVKVSRIVNLADDIALAMAAVDVRIVAPIPGKAAVGVEVPNSGSSMVKLRHIISSDAFQKAKSPLALALGVGIAGEPIIAHLNSMPHLLVAGATGSGKSVCINTLILSILYKAKPEEVKFFLIDPKKVEMTAYKDLPHLLAPVVTDPKKASAVLKMVVQEMENRYELFAGSGSRGIESYNQVMHKRQKAVKRAEEEGKEIDDVMRDNQPLPYIVVIIDELADLMMVAANDVEDAICRLAQMARAAGIHLIIATQRPSVDVITGLIKANIPSRIAFAVSSAVDSRTILDSAGAEKLLGKGDMLFSPVGANKPKRVQGAFVSTEEVQKVIKFIKNQEKPEYITGMQQFEIKVADEKERDELYEEAIRLVVSSSASISGLQRRLHIGYTRAARMIDMMEQDGIVGPYVGSKPRELLVDQDEVENLLKNLKGN